MASGRRVLKFFSGIMRMDAESSVARTEHVAEGSRIDPSQIVRPSALTSSSTLSTSETVTAGPIKVCGAAASGLFLLERFCKMACVFK
jgi:hypothetical protein